MELLHWVPVVAGRGDFGGVLGGNAGLNCLRIGSTWHTILA